MAGEEAVRGRAAEPPGRVSVYVYYQTGTARGVRGDHELLDLGGSIGGPQNTQREVRDSSLVSDLDDRAPGLVQEDDPSYIDLIALVNRPTLICHHDGHERNHEMLFQIGMPCAKRGEQIMRLGTVHDLSNAPSLFSQTQPAILGFKRCNGCCHVLSTVAFCGRKHIVDGETHG